MLRQGNDRPLVILGPADNTSKFRKARIIPGKLDDPHKRWPERRAIGSNQRRERDEATIAITDDVTEEFISKEPTPALKMPPP